MEDLDYIILGLMGVTFVGNLLAIPFLPGHRWGRLARAVIFLVCALVAAFAVADCAPVSGETQLQLIAELVMDLGLAAFFTFVRIPPEEGTLEEVTDLAD